MPSKEELVKNYEESVLSTMKEQDDKHLDPISLFISADPSNNRKYTVWLIKSYIRGGIRKLEDLLSRAKPALENFILLSKHKKLNTGSKPWENQTDINNYFGLRSGVENNKTKLGLESILDQHQEFLNSKKGIKQIKETAKEGLRFVSENKLATVYQPLTEEASCYIGQGTKWCTAAKENNMFEHYSKKGPIFVIVPKKPSYPGEKYQYQHSSNQYMNDKDEEVNSLELFEKFELSDEINNYIVITIYDENLDKQLELIKKYPNIKLSLRDIKDISIFDPKNILQFDFSNEKDIESILDSIGNLTNLNILNLNNNNISTLPDSIGNLTNLNILNLNNNNISTLPDSMANITVNDLNISHNNFTTLPDFIGNVFGSLIDISHNNLSILPDSIFDLNPREVLLGYSNQYITKGLNLSYNKFSDKYMKHIIKMFPNAKIIIDDDSEEDDSEDDEKEKSIYG